MHVTHTIPIARQGADSVASAISQVAAVKAPAHEGIIGFVQQTTRFRSGLNVGPDMVMKHQAHALRFDLASQLVQAFTQTAPLRGGQPTLRAYMASFLPALCVAAVCCDEILATNCSQESGNLQAALNFGHLPFRVAQLQPDKASQHAEPSG